MNTVARAGRVVRRTFDNTPRKVRDEDDPAVRLRAGVLAQHPPFLSAVLADARVAAKRRGERHQYRGRADAGLQVLRLAAVTDSFLAQICYRAKARCQVRGIPVAPWILHRLAISTGQISIGDPVVVHPGVYIPHGQVVLDALTVVHPLVTLSPFVTLGRVVGVMGGPIIGTLAEIGTGAKVLGRIEVGARAKVGANAVVLADVPAGATAVGAPARIVGNERA